MGNRVARLLKAVAWILWIIFVLGILADIYYSVRILGYHKEPFNLSAALPVTAGAFLLGLLFYALGEITGILHDIRESAIRSGRMELLNPFSNRWSHEPKQPPEGEQAETFLWSCLACGEMNLSGSATCRKCGAERQ